LILSTVPSTTGVAELLRGLRVRGTLTVLGVDSGIVGVPVAQLVMNGQHLTGHLTGSPLDTEEAMAFALTNGVRPMVERLPLKDAGEAVARISAGKPRFRIVLDAGRADD
jgi:alcohol dehydrogenase